MTVVVYSDYEQCPLSQRHKFPHDYEQCPLSLHRRRPHDYEEGPLSLRHRGPQPPEITTYSLHHVLLSTMAKLYDLQVIIRVHNSCTNPFILRESSCYRCRFPPPKYRLQTFLLSSCAK